MRLVEIEEGLITIDGVDISKLGVHDLRERIAVIPQDPVMFQGTIRTNVDPIGKHTDAEIIDALQESHLAPTLGEDQTLDTEVKEGGENFSVGQRQLMCLARALLKTRSGMANILLLDEATSQVDQATDELVQKTITEKFSDCTILTIAHRINTIMNYDKILVMDAGRVAEFDTPENLQRDGGLFAELVEKEKREQLEAHNRAAAHDRSLG